MEGKVNRLLLTRVLPVATVIGVAAWGFTAMQPADAGLAAVSAANPAAAPAPFPCGLLKVPFSTSVPGDAPILSDQLDVDCFGWWEFIALNWPSEPDDGFGDPGNLDPVQWETFMSKGLLFQPGAATPPPWGTQPEIPPDCLAQAGLAAANARTHRLLRAASKFTSAFASEFNFPDSIKQAAPFKGPNWLGAQNGTNVWYEVRVNQEEYNYVTAASHPFYNANQQAAWVNTGNGQPIVLPKGSAQAGGPVGAIELKAAWMEAPDPQNAKWQRYKLTPAVVLDPSTNSCRKTTMALVGLHILHKTQSQPTWIWATFEHVDNVPGAAGSSGPYNFYNANCQPRVLQVPAKCLPSGKTSPVTVGCTPNTAPPYYMGPGCPAPVPIQLTRTVPIDGDARNANTTAQSAIAAAFPNSVWQYYQLVNVIWSTSPTQDPTKPVNVNPNGMPLSSMLPTVKVANTTLESYAQTLTCTDCHRYATIAVTAANPNPPWDSDFSFALGSATAPP